MGRGEKSLRSYPGSESRLLIGREQERIFTFEIYSRPGRGASRERPGAYYNQKHVGTGGARGGGDGVVSKKWKSRRRTNVVRETSAEKKRGSTAAGVSRFRVFRVYYLVRRVVYDGIVYRVAISFPLGFMFGAGAELLKRDEPRKN